PSTSATFLRRARWYGATSGAAKSRATIDAVLLRRSGRCWRGGCCRRTATHFTSAFSLQPSNFYIPVTLLTLDSVSLSFGHVPLFERADLRIESGERLAIIGRLEAARSARKSPGVGAGPAAARRTNQSPRHRGHPLAGRFSSRVCRRTALRHTRSRLSRKPGDPNRGTGSRPPDLVAGHLR